MPSDDHFHLPSTALKCALSIATSDSGAGAGIQADLKTFAAHKVYGLSVLSAVTAQNTLEVTGLECLSPDMVSAQLKALFDDMKIEAIKIGLLGNEANTERVTSFLSDKCPAIPMILDPVMVSTSGHSFLPARAIEALKSLMRLATLLTPNLPEAEILSGLKINDSASRKKAAEIILADGAQNILIKGGHGQSPEADDYLLGNAGEIHFKGPRITTPNTHGTGCTMSSAICANLALGLDLAEAISRAKHYVSEGLRHSLTPGHGPGPLNHFHSYYHLENPKKCEN